MEKSINILEKIRENNAEIKRAEAIIEEAGIRARRLDEAIIAIAEKAGDLKITNCILHDNARRALFAEVMPAALDILNGYAGKPYGEKTKEKIRQALIARANCSIYITASYSDSITLVPLNDKGFSGTLYKYNDFEIYTNCVNGKRKKILVDNKIQRLTMEDLYLTDCAAYVEDVSARVADIKAAFDAVKKANTALEAACGQFNKLLPKTINRMYSGHIRNYLGV